MTINVKYETSYTHHCLFCLQVTVGGSVSSSDVVVISLNQPANTVENKIPPREEVGRGQLTYLLSQHPWWKLTQRLQ